MARGIVGSRGERPTVASPLHKEVYDLATGECFTNPALVLQTFRTRVVGGMIEVEAAPVSAPALRPAARISHGTSSPEGQDAVARLVAARRPTRCPVRPSPAGSSTCSSPTSAVSLSSLADGVPAVVVPLLLSAGYHVHVDLGGSSPRISPATPCSPRPSAPTTGSWPCSRSRLAEVGLRPNDRVVLAGGGLQRRPRRRGLPRDGTAPGRCARPHRSTSASCPPRRPGSRMPSPWCAPCIRLVTRRREHLPPCARLLRRSRRGDAGADVATAPLLIAGEAPPTELVDIVVDRYDVACRAALAQEVAAA